MSKLEKMNLRGLKELKCRQSVLDWVDSCGEKCVNVHKKQGCPGFFKTYHIFNTYESELSVPIAIQDITLVAGETKLKTDIPFMYDDETKIYASNDRLVFVLPQGYEGNKVIYIFDKVA